MQYLLLGSVLKQGISNYREDINTWPCAIGHGWVSATEWAILGLLKRKSGGSHLRGQPVIFPPGFPLDYCNHFSSDVCPLTSTTFPEFL